MCCFYLYFFLLSSTKVYTEKDAHATWIKNSELIFTKPSIACLFVTVTGLYLFVTSRHITCSMPFNSNAILFTASQCKTAMPFPIPYVSQNFTIFQHSLRFHFNISVNSFVLVISSFLVPSRYFGPMLEVYTLSYSFIEPKHSSSTRNFTISDFLISHWKNGVQAPHLSWEVHSLWFVYAHVYKAFYWLRMRYRFVHNMRLSESSFLLYLFVFINSF